jgi:hypothetical protein
VNAVFAYRYRSRKMRSQGQEPPPFLVYLFFPRPLPSRVSVPRPVRIILGLIILSGGAFFLLIGFLLFTDRHAMQSQLVGSVVAVALLAALGATFAYVGFRLMSMVSDKEQLFARKGKESDAA